MSQNDLTIANQGFASFRSDLNSALQALGSTNSGTSAPSTTFANQLFYDTTNNILKIRNEDNDAFISLFTLDQANDNIESLTVDGILTVATSVKTPLIEFTDGDDALTITDGGNVAVGGTLTANAGVIVDNITIDGTEIDLSSGDLTIDVAGTISLDADGGGIYFKDDGTTIGEFINSSSDFMLKSAVQDKDILFKGNDGGSTITALSLDMSESGIASFNNGAYIPGIIIQSSLGSGGLARQTTASGSHSYTADKFRNSSGTEVGKIEVGTSSTAYNTSSDYRLKESITYDFDATTRLKQLKPARFNWIADDTNTSIDGFIAHEVSSIVPEAITGTKDATQEIKNVILNADGSFLTDNINQKKWEEGKTDKIYADNTTWVASKTVPNYQSIDQSKLVPLLTKTILELEARITALEGA